MPNLKQGYKYTEEFGYIPEDWDVKSFDETFSFLSTNAVTREELVEEGVIKNVHYGDILVSYPSILNSCDIKTYIGNVSLSNLKYAKNGDIIIADTAEDETVGRAVELKGLKDNEKVVSGMHTMFCRPKDVKSFASGYLGYFINSDVYHNQLLPLITGIKVSSISKSEIKTTMVIVPEYKEQEKIADVLEDVDSLIDKTQQLINKKKDLKTATMQKLLTPKENWVTYKLGDCSKICTGNENNENKVEDGLYPFFVRSENIERINTYSYDGEAILVPGEGGIGNIFHYINGRFNYHQRVYKISDFRYIDGKYTYYYMKKYFGKYALSNTVKATVDSLRLPTFEEFNIKCPELAEQKIISQTISDMDAEIEALEKKLSKYKDLKTGMMQQLLTGKIRLLGKSVEQDDNVVSIEDVATHKVANDEFKDAILISILAYKFGNEQYPLGAFRRQKLSYFYKRHANMNIDEYTKKAMGPYNSKMKYQGAENIAIRNKYVKKVGNRGIVATNLISKAEEYYNRYYNSVDMQWLDANFHYENNNNLEVLATVDYAINDLVSQNKAITLANIKTYIASDEEWKPKLDLNYFTDNNIVKAMEKIKKLFNSY